MGCLVAILDTGFRMSKSKVQRRSTFHSPLYCCRAAGVPVAPISLAAAPGARHSTRESSHDVSNNIRGEKSILAIFSKDFFVVSGSC